MMHRFGMPRIVKVMSTLMAIIFLGGIFVMGMVMESSGSAAEAAANSAIGVVDFQRVVTSSPLIDNVRNTMKNEVAAAEKDFTEKAKSMSEQEKQKFGSQLQNRLMNRENELMTPLLNQINAVIKRVADKKGLSVVVHKNTVVFGGVDITEEVVKGLKE
ncbi:MAG: OmpH family outer membrane protein [Phascolarctobacterium sp.]|nr:OmpH family outer membrane protein [Candidatus Phascolarctobacterium caballi]